MGIDPEYAKDLEDAAKSSAYLAIAMTLPGTINPFHLFVHINCIKDALVDSGIFSSNTTENVVGSIQDEAKRISLDATIRWELDVRLLEFCVRRALQLLPQELEALALIREEYTKGRNEEFEHPKFLEIFNSVLDNIIQDFSFLHTIEEG